MKSLNVIRRPLVTEKNTYHAESNVYVFEVDQKATKVDVKSAVEKAFSVKVESVRTMNCRGRSKRTAKGIGAVPYWKKAMVRLAEGQKIKIFEGA